MTRPDPHAGFRRQRHPGFELWVDSPEESTAAFAQSVVRGLGDHPRWLHCRYLYDARGSELFERITEQPEYYLTRTETALLEELEPAAAEALFRAVVRLARPVREALGAAGTTIGVNNGEATGQTIPHVHFHIVPRWHGDGAGSIHTIFPRRTRRSLAEVGAAIRRARGVLT